MTQSQTSGSGANYRAMLALVIILGMLIMLGVGALIGAAYMASGRSRAQGGGGQAGASVAGATPFLANLAAPGQRIESAELREGRLLIRLTGPRGEELAIVDAANGAIVGRVVLIPPAP